MARNRPETDMLVVGGQCCRTAGNERGAPKRASHAVSWRRLVVGAEARVFLVADVEAGKDRILDGLAVDQLDHHVRGPLAHFERTLPDLGVAAAFTESLGLRRQGVAGDDD